MKAGISKECNVGKTILSVWQLNLHLSHKHEAESFWRALSHDIHHLIILLQQPWKNQMITFLKKASFSFSSFAEELPDLLIRAVLSSFSSSEASCFYRETTEDEAELCEGATSDFQPGALPFSRPLEEQTEVSKGVRVQVLPNTENKKKNVYIF